MPGRSSHTVSIVAVLIAATAIGLVCLGRGSSRLIASPIAWQEPAPAAHPALAERYFLASTCGRCHSGNSNQGVTDFVKLDEYRTWSGLDKHSQAFKSLQNDRSKRMGELLGWNVTNDARCLSCHAPAHADPRLSAADADPKLRADLLNDGVSCASCHGPHTEWVGEHAILEQEEKWIAKTPAEKRDVYGMTDLRNPTVRAETCASCHVGDASRNRVVTHDMYAAGHPPLPGLETATFSQAEPPHWWAAKDVPHFKKLPPEIHKHYGYDQAQTQQARIVAEGGIVAFREAMRLFAETANHGLDFARFDCASCHHELKTSDTSWRQSRGFTADPGRPPAADWPAALLSLGLVAGDPAMMERRVKELSDKLRVYHDAVGKSPFGDAASSAAAARELIAWSDALLLDLQRTKLDHDAAIRMLRQITEITPRDHASARQLAWGFRNIFNELDPKPANASQINAALNRLSDVLGINLTPGNVPGTVEREVGARLDADEKFDPETVNRLLGTLRALLATNHLPDGVR